MLAGVGAAVLTKEKVEEALGELVDKGKISANEAKETARKISERRKAGVRVRLRNAAREIWRAA